MSTRLLKKFLQKSLELDELAPILVGKNQIKPSLKEHKEKKTKYQKKVKQKSISNIAGAPGKKPEKDEILKSQVQSVLLFDEAFSQTSGSTKASLKRKTREGKDRQKMQKRIKSMSGTLSNSRSSSSCISNLKPEPTYNKKNAASEKELKNLEDLARRLFESKKGKKRNP